MCKRAFVCAGYYRIGETIEKTLLYHEKVAYTHTRRHVLYPIRYSASSLYNSVPIMCTITHYDGR